MARFFAKTLPTLKGVLGANLCFQQYTTLTYPWPLHLTAPLERRLETAFAVLTSF